MGKLNEKKPEPSPAVSLSGKKKELLRLLEKSARSNAPKEKFGLLFSGGIDSLLLALVCKSLGLRFKCFYGFVAGLGQPKDLAFAEKAAKELGLELEAPSVSLKEAEELVPKLVQLTGFSSPVHVGVALPMAVACRAASKQGIRAVFSGMGADELFCGYAKFRSSKDLAADSMRLVQALPENDLKRDQAIAFASNLALKTPFLNAAITKFALSLPPEMKLSAKQNKVILRELAKDLGLSKGLAERKKVAAQYGSNADKAIEKLAKKTGYRAKSSFTASFSAKPGIAALFSGGKDSCLALWLMQKKGFSVECLVSVLPENEDSFMYHKPEKALLELQSKALEISLVLERTPGEKEEELSALKKALLKAKRDYSVKGVVSGALYSSYQKDRIQKICAELGLELFSPLWHMGQQAELELLLKEGFVFIMTKVAAMGLGSDWLGKPIGEMEVSILESLSKKLGSNVAGEGGEFESLVLDAPNFRQRLVLTKFERKMYNEFTGQLKAIGAKLEPKL
jgi:asparagine synthase (glutamine-hydrolysing)